MATTVKTGWLNDQDGDKFAPKTLTSQVQTNDGVLLEAKIQQDIEDAIKNITIPSVEGLATKEYVDGKVTALVDAAPEELNTLSELATALQKHEDAYDALLEVVGNKSNSDHNHDDKYDPLGSAEQVKSEVSTMINNLGIEKGSKTYSVQSKSNESEANQYRKTLADGSTSVALGRFSRALGDYTYTIGLGTETIAPDKTNGKLQRSQMVVGTYNELVDGELTSGGNEGARFVVGVGKTDTARKNGLVVWGNGRVTAGANPEEEMDVVTLNYLEQKQNTKANVEHTHEWSNETFSGDLIICCGSATTLI